MNLRPYQVDAIAAARRQWSGGQRSALVVLPTGTGKTATALSQVATAARAGHRVLWLAHREELLTQPMRTLTGVYADLAPVAGIVQAARDDADRRIVFGAADTLRGEARLARYLAHGAPVLTVVDEAHHYLGNLYEALLDAVGSRYELGLTATPDRADGKKLSTRWGSKPAYTYMITRAIRDGFLVPPTFAKEYLPTLDLSGVSGGNDWNAEQLGGVMLASGAVEHTVSAMQAHAVGRRALVFTANVEQARQTSEALRAAGRESRWLSGTTSPADRRRMLDAFVAGHIDTICNCAVLTEGTDLPPCDCIVVARPTRSRPLYMQILGRGLRTFPRKEDCLVIDIVGASDEHRMIVAPILLDEIEREELGEDEVERKKQPKRDPGRWKRNRPPVASWVTLPQLDRTALAVDCGDHGIVAVVDTGDGWTSTLLPKKGAPQPLTDGPVDYDLAVGLGEDVARQARALTWGRAGWRRQAATEGQLNMVGRFGVMDVPKTKGEAAELITREVAFRAVARAGLAKRTRSAA